MRSLVLVFCLLVGLAANAELKPEDFKPVLLGRKDLIRNDLIKSNNELCFRYLDGQFAQFTALNRYLMILTDENKKLEAELADCKQKVK